MTEAREIAERYIATWNAADAAVRANMIAAHWAEDVTYVDPMMSGSGGGEVSGLIGAVQDRFPGFRFRLLGSPDGHGRWVRFSWGLGPEGADPLIEGSDVVEQDDGRIQRVIGFLDKVPAMA